LELDFREERAEVRPQARRAAEDARQHACIAVIDGNDV
jgi:hypothetical protein